MTTTAITLRLRGELPSKKNDRQIRRWGPRVGIGNSREKEVLMAALAWQAREQWGQREPLEHPKMSFQFTVKHRRKDRDNLLTTVLDVLVTAGVLVSDSISKFNGTLTILPAIINKHAEEGVEIGIYGSGF